MQSNGPTHPDDFVDLRPLQEQSDAVDVLLLARGQLNRAFRKHNLLPPDPLTVGSIPYFDQSEIDDPAGCGITLQHDRLGKAFAVWASRMPRDLVDPVLAILLNTHAGLGADRGRPAQAVRAAYEYLRRFSRLDRND